jgi:lipopolysaccharide export system protein LptC
LSVSPLSVRPAPRRSGQRIAVAAAGRIRKPVSPGRLARRRFAVNAIKWTLPAGALLLLSSMALWPELGRLRDQERISLQRMTSAVGGATLTDARYRGVDEQGRPFTLTAAVAQQVTDERIDLTAPKADIALANGTWLMLQSKHGVYLQNTNQLDLSQDVTLYRDDGTTVATASASIDLRLNAAAGAEPTHAEGPFGMLDAQGFTITDKGTAIQFTGPAHLVLNGNTP